MFSRLYLFKLIGIVTIISATNFQTGLIMMREESSNKINIHVGGIITGLTEIFGYLLTFFLLKKEY